MPAACRLRETVAASGLLQPGQFEAAESEVRLVMAEAEAGPAAWDQAVADTLVAQGLLTKFQARELLAGRRRFRLGQYTVLDEIGRGGMGQVFRAEHAMMGREVALKVLPRAKATPEYEAAFRREIRMLARLDHENLVRALDAGHDAKVYYLVTELVPGLDLRKQVLKYGPLDDMAAASVISQAACGLAYAHEQGLVHRDVKPGNLLVTQDGKVKVLDLGLAGSTLDPETVGTGRVVGTMDYMAPEQIRFPDAVGPAADVYGLGCTLYFALSGQVPFPGGTRKEKAQRQLTETPVPLGQLVPHVDPAFCRLVEEMMRKSPEDRIHSADEVMERLRTWTPRTRVPMSRTPVAGGDRRPADTARLQPPPLPAAAGEPASSQSGHGLWPPGEEGWPASVGPGDDFPWPLHSPPGTTAVFPDRRHAAGLVAALREIITGPSAPELGRAAGIAAVVGVTFGGVMRLIRGLDAERFDGLLGSLSPTGLGVVAFLLLFVVQAAALLGRRQRR
ncbi:MAG: serine/threonine-protein kinase [Planctomycetia bacterium]